MREKSSIARGSVRRLHGACETFGGGIGHARMPQR